MARDGVRVLRTNTGCEGLVLFKGDWLGVGVVETKVMHFGVYLS
jgi:hypothetical protein